MLVWVLTKEYEPWIIGGLGVVATYLSRALADLDLDVIVFTRGQGDTQVTREGHVTVVRLPRRHPYYYPEHRLYHEDPILALAERHDLGRPQVVHVHSVAFTSLAVGLRQRHGVPVVYTCHSLVCNEPWSHHRSQVRERQERLLAVADQVVVPSQWQRRGLIGTYAHCADKVRVIANGVEIPDDPQFASLPGERLEDPVIRLLFAGRLMEQKGIEQLLYAVALLRPRGLPVTLDVVGHGGHTYQARLEKLAQRLRITEYVHWCGFRPRHEMYEVYTSHDLVVMPSKEESFGLVALEAMACGVPLVSTQAGGLEEFVDEQVAQLIPRVHWRAIAEAITSALGSGEKRMARVSEGRRRAERYAWPRVACSYRELFADLVQPPTNSRYHASPE